MVSHLGSDHLSTCADCGSNPSRAKGLCNTCYQRMRSRTDPKDQCSKCKRWYPKIRINKGICPNCRAKKKGLGIRRQLIREKGDQCVGCGKLGKGNYRKLEFHHRDPNIKTFKLTVHNCGRYSLEKLRVEADKCEVLCHTCHLLAHGRKPIPGAFFRDDW